MYDIMSPHFHPIDQKKSASGLPTSGVQRNCRGLWNICFDLAIIQIYIYISVGVCVCLYMNKRQTHTTYIIYVYICMSSSLYLKLIYGCGIFGYTVHVNTSDTSDFTNELTSLTLILPCVCVYIYIHKYILLKKYI